MPDSILCTVCFKFVFGPILVSDSIVLVAEILLTGLFDIDMTATIQGQYNAKHVSIRNNIKMARLLAYFIN